MQLIRQIVQSTSLELHSHSQQKGQCHNCWIRLGQARDCTLTRMMLAAASTNPHRIRWDRLPAGRTSSPIVVIFCEIGGFFPGENPKVAKSRSKSIPRGWDPHLWGWILTLVIVFAPQGFGGAATCGIFWGREAATCGIFWGARGGGLQRALL